MKRLIPLLLVAVGATCVGLRAHSVAPRTAPTAFVVCVGTDQLAILNQLVGDAHFCFQPPPEGPPG